MVGPEGAVREAFGQIVGEFIDHDAGRYRCVVPDTASGVGDDEPGPGRQQRFDHGETILVTDVAVASLTRTVGHEIEGRGTRRGGKDIAVHAHQANDAGRQGLSFGEPCLGDTVTQPGRVRGGSVGEAVKDIADDLEGECRADLGCLVLELPDGSAQGVDLIGFLGEQPAGRRHEEAVDHVVKGGDPVSGAAFLSQTAAQAEDGLAVGHELTQDLVVALRCELKAPALQPAGSNAVNRPADIRHRIPQEKAAQALVPGIAGFGDLALVPAVIGIDPPADRRGMHPAPDVDQARHVDTETPADQRGIERRHHFPRRRIASGPGSAGQGRRAARPPRRCARARASPESVPATQKTDAIAGS